MRVALVCQHFDHFDAESGNSVGAATRELGLALARTDEVSIICPGRDPKRVTRADVGPLAVYHMPARRSDLVANKAFKATRPLHPLVNRGFPIAGATSLLGAPGYGHDAANQLRKLAPDVILVQHNPSRVPPIKARLPRTPTILLLHAVPLVQELSGRYLRAARQADVVAGISRFLARKAADRLGRDVTTIHNGIAPAFLDVRRVRSGEGPVILYVGAVSPEKGVHLLVEAFAAVAREVPDARLDLVGEVGVRSFNNFFDLDDAEAIAPVRRYFDLGRRWGDALLAPLAGDTRRRVRIHGPLYGDALRARFAAADLFVFPSVCAEGFGLPVAEAMAAGVPTIVSDSGALPEIVGHGEAGIVVPRNDADALAKAILSLLASPQTASAVAEAGRRRVAAEYTWERAARDLRALV